MTAKHERDGTVRVSVKPGGHRRAGHVARRVGEYDDSRDAVEAMLEAFDDATEDDSEHDEDDR